MSITIKQARFSYGPNIIKDNFGVYLDAGNILSYPGSGSIWYDLVGYNDGTLYDVDFSVNTMSFTSSTGYTSVSGGVLSGNCTVEFIINKNEDISSDKYVAHKGVYFEIKYTGNDTIYFLRKTNDESANFGDSTVTGYTGIYLTLSTTGITHVIFTQNAATGEFKAYENAILKRTTDGFYNNVTLASTGYSGLDESGGFFKLGY